MAATAKNSAIHKILSIAGLSCLLVWIVLSIYEESNYSRGLDLHIFGSPGVYIIAAIIAAYFVLNYAWHRSRIKKQLLGGFFVIALVNTIALFFVTVEWVKEMFPKKTASGILGNVFDGLFKSLNPPPQWLEFMNNTLPAVVMLMITICFILLLCSRKESQQVHAG